MLLGCDFELFNQNWFIITFIENNGAAFGFLADSGKIGKIALTLFRIFVVIIGVYYIKKIITKLSSGAIIAMGLIVGGAIGNIIDSTFYGMIFSASEYCNPNLSPAEFFPNQGGYAAIFQGKVVDMFHFPLFNIDLPNWLAISIPFTETNLLAFLEGEDGVFTFFKPVFNLADAAITVGLFLTIIFYRKEF